MTCAEGRQPTEGLLMTVKCDFCRGALGLNAQRYWRMQFCSTDCVGSYQRRLDEATIHKVSRLEGKLGGPRTVATFGGNLKKEAA